MADSDLDTAGEFRRVADQRTADLATVAEKELERAREQGRKEGTDAREAAETARQLAAMVTSVVELRGEVVVMRNQLTAIKSEQDTRDAVNAALIAENASKGAKKLSRWQGIALALGSVVGVGSLIIAVLQTVGHG